MKTRIENIRFIILFLIGSSILISCSKRLIFNISPVVPAAEGKVKIKNDKNGNYSINLKIIHLAEPKRLSTPKDMYVVWMETEQNGIKNLGKLKTSSNLVSKTLKSSMKTVTPFKPKSIFITAEDDADIQRPIGQEVLRTN